MEIIIFDDPQHRDVFDGSDHFKVDPDGYIYVIETKRVDDGELFYYVGLTSDIDGRLRDHTLNPVFQTVLKPRVHEFGTMWKNAVTGKSERRVSEQGLDTDSDLEYLVSPKQVDFEVDGIVILKGLYQQDHERSDRFRQRLQNEERKTAYETAIELETTNILGGK